MNDAASWSDFWAHNARADSGGCLPQRWAVIEEAQRAAWRNFVAQQPQGARVLDLATGDGRVLRWMQSERADLQLIGVDLAPKLPAPPPGTQTRGGVAMEDLPFAAGEFNAVVSQFGFEYGDIPRTSAEIARVLAPGGTVGLMVHRGDGPILAHNLARRIAIEWVLREQKLAKTLVTALDAPNGGPSVATQIASAIARLGAHKFGQDSPGWEIPEALHRAVIMGTRAGRDAVVATIREIEERAANEIGRIASLERACAAADRREAIVAAFQAKGLSNQSCSEVCEPSGNAFASFLTFS